MDTEQTGETCMANPDICRQCDLKGQSCCSLDAECKDTFRAPVSDAEIGRILNHFKNRKCEELFESHSNSQFFLERMSALFPGMEELVPSAFPTTDTHRELRTENGSCVLKDATGCLLPDLSILVFRRAASDLSRSELHRSKQLENDSRGVPVPRDDP